jgi:hypothetical protein
MANITTTERRGALSRCIWFIALWCAGVGSALLVGEAFKLLMNATLFAVSK